MELSTGADETTQLDRLLLQWQRRARESQRAHYRAATSVGRRHLWLGIPATVLAALVGSAVFAGLTKDVGIAIKIATGSLSIAAGVMAALQTFLRFSERAETHRSIAARYGSVRRQIEEFQAYPPSQRPAVKEFIGPLRDLLDGLAREAPPVAPHIWKDVERDIPKEDNGRLAHLGRPNATAADLDNDNDIALPSTKATSSAKS